MKNVVTIAGVPLVRVVKQNKVWYVQTRENENSDVWTSIGEEYYSKDEALDHSHVMMHNTLRLFLTPGVTEACQKKKNNTFAK